MPSMTSLSKPLVKFNNGNSTASSLGSMPVLTTSSPNLQIIPNIYTKQIHTLDAHCTYLNEFRYIE